MSSYNNYKTMENLLLNFTVQILTLTYRLYIDVSPNVLMLKVRHAETFYLQGLSCSKVNYCYLLESNLFDGKGNK